MSRQENKAAVFIKSMWHRFANYGSIDIWFLIIVLALLCTGLIMMFSASYPYAHIMYGDSTNFIKKQAIYAVIGIVIMFAMSHIKSDFWRLMMPLVCGITLFLLIIVFVLPQYRAGFYRWINLGFTTFQPSEIAKFAVIVAGAYYYSKYHKKMSSTKVAKGGWAGKVNGKIGAGLIKESWVPTWMFCLFFGGCSILVFLENHLSGCILIFGIGAVMMYLGGVRTRWFVIFGSIAIGLIVIVCVYIMSTRDAEGTNFLKGYMEERIVGWLDKDYEPRGVRWQTNQALYAIGSGGFFGKGLGNSTQKYMYVSEPQNDMIFSIVCEELGFVGASLIILLFVLLVYRGVVIGLNAKTRFSTLLAMGLVFQVGLQVLLNIAVASDSIPNTGISLPFFSYGGTSLVMLLAEMGIVLGVSREGKLKKK